MDNNDNHSLIPDLPTRKVTMKDKINHANFNQKLIRNFEKNLQKYISKSAIQREEERQQECFFSYIVRIQKFIPPILQSQTLLAEWILSENFITHIILEKNVVYEFPIAENPFAFSTVDLKSLYRRIFRNTTRQRLTCPNAFALFINELPTEDEFLSIFYWHLKTLLYKKKYLHHQTFPPHSIHVKIIRAKVCRYIIENYKEYSEAYTLA